MGSRIELQTLLESLLDSRNVYYQPPEDFKISYPAIIYSKSRIDKSSANNKAYKLSTRYEIIVIDSRPDNPVIQKLLELPFCTYDRQYKSDNLNHDVLTLYF